MNDSIHLLRSSVFAWAAINYPSLNFSDSGIRAAVDTESAAVNATIRQEQEHVRAAVNAVSDVAASVGSIKDMVSSFQLSIDSLAAANTGGTIRWQEIQRDCEWLAEFGQMKGASRNLSRLPLSLRSGRDIRPRHLTNLIAIDLNYAVWIHWYERRVRGERAAFDIPGDKYRKEDKKILRRLAEATDEDFWGKGHEYVNATLNDWLDEARARVAPAQALSVGMATETSEALALPPLPPQDPGAIAYGINDQGKLDRLPNSDQVHLRDVPDQRRAYSDMREAAAELLDEGQRLGHRLARALDRFLQSLPERFEDAEAYLVWRDANPLRRLHRAHREAAKSPEFDEAKLEPVVAEGLGGLLDLYNNFAFADDGLRAKDEARISPQERAVAEEEAAAAVPLIEAILATPDISTPHARNDIAIEAENIHFPSNDPYTTQALAQSNRTISNCVAGLLSGVKEAASNPKTVGKALTLGSIGKVGEATTEAILSANYAPLFEFIATNGPALQSYAAIAFASFPHLPDLIASIGAIWNSFKNRGTQ
jgi:hypothetical protein